MAVIIKTFLVQPFYVPSESMLPTIEVNDRVMISKLNYRFSDPRRGDIVVFISPFNDEIDNESFLGSVGRHILEAVGVRTASADDLIKRVVGIEGDTIEVKGGYFYINGMQANEPYLVQAGVMPDFSAVVVPTDTVFVMGDNRGVSYDSRKFGTIPEEDLLGEAVVRIWPLSRLGSIDSVTAG